MSEKPSFPTFLLSNYEVALQAFTTQNNQKTFKELRETHKMLFEVLRSLGLLEKYEPLKSAHELSTLSQELLKKAHEINSNFGLETYFGMYGDKLMHTYSLLPEAEVKQGLGKYRDHLEILQKELGEVRSKFNFGIGKLRIN